MDEHLARGQALLAAAEVDAEAVAARAGMVLFTSACLVADRLADGLRLVQEAGLAVVFAHRVAMTQEQVRAIWRTHAFSARRWAVAERLFTAGPAMVVMVAEPHTASGEPLAPRLKRLQGPSRPALLRSHHLRHRLGAANTVNNLVHVAENPAATVRESAILLEPATFSAAWRAVAAVRPAPDLELAIEASRSPARPDAVCVVRVGLRLWARALTSGGEPPQALRDALVEQLAWSAGVERHGAQAGCAWRERYGDAGLGEALARWLADAHDPAAARRAAAVTHVDALMRSRPTDLDALERDLQESGLAPERWELICLATEAVALEDAGCA